MIHDFHEAAVIAGTFAYDIKRSRRAKRARVVVTADRVEVVAPLRMSETDIHAFVRLHSDWVERTRGQLKARQAQLPPLFPRSFGNGEEVVFQGCGWPLELRHAARRRAMVAFDGGFVVTVPDDASHVRDAVVRDALRKWMRGRVLDEAHRCAARHAPRFALHPRSIRIREQKTRWGSCGIHNDIQINWRLIFAPAQVLEYVVVHELCHIRHRNHSQNFWDLVAAHLPEYGRERAWLRRHGAWLMGEV